MNASGDTDKHLIIHTDGGARGNPGPAGIGVSTYDAGRRLIGEHKAYLGRATNNQAEYLAVIAALERAADMNAEILDFFLDSELVVKQLKGEYRVKNADLAPLVQKVLNAIKKFKRVNFSYVPREKNASADKLVNQAIDEALATKEAEDE